jgi:putative ABC transport system ATP-binding protein
VITLNNISRRFRTKFMETTAIDNVSLSIENGEFVSILGASGCGKSTLLRILGLLDPPDSGELYYFDKNVLTLSKSEAFEFRRRNIGFIFQDLNLIDELNIIDNVSLPLIYQSVKPEAAKRIAMESLDRVGIAHRAKHLPSHLSGGQQQRVAIARALAIEPKLILADEPTGNLDSENGNSVIEALLDCNKEGATVVLVTHDHRYINIGDRSIQLHNGSVVEELVV